VTLAWIGQKALIHEQPDLFPANLDANLIPRRQTGNLNALPRVVSPIRLRLNATRGPDASLRIPMSMAMRSSTHCGGSGLLRIDRFVFLDWLPRTRWWCIVIGAPILVVTLVLKLHTDIKRSSGAQRRLGRSRLRAARGFIT
jgi:hypothetical protein